MPNSKGKPITNGNTGVGLMQQITNIPVFPFNQKDINKRLKDLIRDIQVSEPISSGYWISGSMESYLKTIDSLCNELNPDSK